MKEPIRVLQVVTIMNLGGLENFLMNLYRKVDRSKIQFDFLVHRQERGAFDDEIEQLGGKIYRLTALHPFKYFSYRKMLKDFFRQHPEYKIIHSHINEGNAIVLSIAKECGVQQRISHSHIDTTIGKFGVLREIPKRLTSRYSSFNYACSVNAGKWLYGKNEFEVFKNSIDVNRFKFNRENRNKIRKQLNLSDDQLLVGNIARFNTQKNHRFLVEVFFEFLKLKPDSKLILIGEGNLENEIKARIHHLKIEKNVIFTGVVFNTEEYLSAMDLFLFPSLFEGLGIVAVEAQCNGLPVLMSENIPDETVLTDLIQIKSLKSSVKEWTEKLFEMSGSKQNRIEYAEMIRQKGFDIETNAEKLTKFYLSCYDSVQ